ncbi:hypothetical protein FHG87_020920, partial [Trinorchestia longiramus]
GQGKRQGQDGGQGKRQGQDGGQGKRQGQAGMRMQQRPKGNTGSAVSGFCVTNMRYYNRTAYVGTYTNDETKLHYPGVSAGAAQLLASYYQASGRRVVGVGIDTMSIDPGSSRDFLAHQALASQNIYMLENVANLEELPVTGAQVTVLPIKLKRGSGGPCRVLAHIPDSGAIGLGRPTLPSLLLVLVSLLFVH